MEKVDILLSVYQPNEQFLKEQLLSINVQTYKNIEVVIFDDCVDKPCNQDIFYETLTNVSFRILPYEKSNLGYTKAFEKLTLASTGKYIAFCDQDDVWFPQKIELCVKELEESSSLLVATDRMIIDENSQVTCNSVRAHSNKPYENWHSFDDICKYNIFIAYAVGMSMVVNGDLARKVVPFPICTGHDKWVMACASAEGTVSFINRPLVQYRRHGGNISGTLKGIKSKKDYREQRILDHIKIIEEFEKCYPEHKDLAEIKKFAYARRKHNLIDIIKFRNLAPDVAKFEVVLFFVPNICFEFLLKIVRKKNDSIIK